MPVINDSYELRVLLIEEDNGYWSAQCLDYDIVAQGRTLTQLRYEFEKTFIGYLALSEAEDEDLLEKIGPAPREFWELYEQSDMNLSVEKALVDRVPPMKRPVPKPHFRVAERVAA